MISNRELELLISGHWKSLTRTQQVDMARELMTYRQARAEFQPGWGDDPVQASIEAFVEMRVEGNG
jgi:hypothetical protein